MFNLLSQGITSMTFKSTTASGTMTDPNKAYDVEEYPFSTFGTTGYTGSAVAGTADNNVAIFSGFDTLSKANFSSAILQIYINHNLTSVVQVGSSGWIITAAMKVEYSSDSGSTWKTMLDVGSAYRIGDMIYPTNYPAIDLSVTGLTAAASGVASGYWTIQIPAADFTTGLQNLQVKFTSSTLKSTRTGNPSSSLVYKIYDIRAIVS